MGGIGAAAVTEHDEQAALFDWKLWQQNIMPELRLLHAIPNGQYRPGQRPEPGLEAGVPDISLPVPRGDYHGFYGELKVKKNKTSEHQERWINDLRDQGYCVVVAYGFEAMKDAILEYLEAEL